MSTALDVYLDQILVGHLGHDSITNTFSFIYTQHWQNHPKGFSLCPSLPRISDFKQSPEKHSALVRQFFENLLPEGEALDIAAQVNNISKANLVGLFIALGKETAGAIRIAMPGVAQQAFTEQTALRQITSEELSERMGQRSQIPFSVWDGKVRLSIAGYQDKVAVHEKKGQWFLVDDPRLASTVIIKPMPQSINLANLPANEFFCMRLAKAINLPVAEVRLAYVPEPILLVSRFDRIETKENVHRLHVIDGCQALGFSVAMKYERPYGDGRDVRDIRDGVSYPLLFELINRFSVYPAKDRTTLLRWVIFQVLIGNTDAHGKNLSFFVKSAGLSLAPAYDLVCIPALRDETLSQTFAMSIGDAFTESEITASDWFEFAVACGLTTNFVKKTIEKMTQNILNNLNEMELVSRENHISKEVADALILTISRLCERQKAISKNL
jgi:serine/threonine-protein kinase HipA